MTTVTAIRTRLALCPRCGHPARLIVATDQATVSRCRRCGDELQVTRTAAAANVPARAAVTN